MTRAALRRPRPVIAWLLWLAPGPWHALRPADRERTSADHENGAAGLGPGAIDRLKGADL